MLVKYAFLLWGILAAELQHRYRLPWTSYCDGTPSVRHAYDRRGRRRLSVTDGVLTNAFAYSDAGSCTNETQNGVAVERTFDALGRQTGLSADGGYAASYSYDGRGRLSEVTAGGGTFRYLYEPWTETATGMEFGSVRKTVSREPLRDLVAAISYRAQVHTHPEKTDTPCFSPGDINWTKRTCVPLALRNISNKSPVIMCCPDGKCRQIDPVAWKSKEIP